jgi:hypothetical protein
MTITRTYTKTFAIYGAWASTLPWNCLARETGCISATHDHSPMVNDPCAEPQCDELLAENEECYAVTELPSIEAPPLQNPAGRVRRREQWACWRHVRPDDGPVRATAI